jgi:hypothetical protein
MALNLVKLQEDLKLMPYDRIVAYANGANPSLVPPYMATIESQRRAKLAQQAQAEQAKQAVGAPTIKDQLVQSTGLMALQSQQQPQQAQQAAPQQTAPQGMPQAAPQMPTVMAAGGGLMELPLREDMFSRQDYAGGGIVAFSGEDGSYVDEPVGTAPWEIATESERRRYPGLRAEFAREIELLRKLLSGGGDPEFYNRQREEVKKAADQGEVKPSFAFENERIAAPEAPAAPQSITPVARGAVGAPDGRGGASRAQANPELEYFRKRYGEAAPDYMAMLREQGLDKRPEAGRELEAAKKQLADYAAKSDDFVSRLMALKPGRFSSGITGRSAAEYEQNRQAKINNMTTLIAKAEDLDAKAEFEFRKGNVDKAFTIKNDAQKARDDAAKAAGNIGINLEQIAAQREQTAAGREATAEGRRATIITQIERARTTALAHATRQVVNQLKDLQATIGMGGQVAPTVKAEIDRLRAQQAFIEDEVNRKYDQMVAQAGGGAGQFKVIGVRPGS